MKVKDIDNIIEKLAPKNTAMDFDNVGLLVGNAENEVSGILITLDVTPKALAYALQNNCNLIIAHHPLIFHPISKFLTDDYKNVIITKAFVNNISIYCAHTNFDCMKGNMAWKIAEKLKLNIIGSLDESGLGVITFIKSPVSVEILAQNLIEITGDTKFKITGNPKELVKQIAIVNGAGGDSQLLHIAKAKGADVLISSEFKHHNLLEAEASGLNLIEISHYASEKCFIDIVNDSLACHIDTKIIKWYEGNPYI